MQYALMQIGDKKCLIDANEVDFLNKSIDLMNLEESYSPNIINPTKAPLKIVYGAVFSCFDKEGSYFPLEVLKEEVNNMCKVTYYTVINDSEVISSNIIDTIILDPIDINGRWFIPFACLMETTLEFNRSQCQSFFKAYFNMSVLDSFANRRCIFAIYTKENWILGSIEDLCNSNDNMYLWKMFVNDETLFNVAYNIDETIV